MSQSAPLSKAESEAAKRQRALRDLEEKRKREAPREGNSVTAEKKTESPPKNSAAKRPRDVLRKTLHNALQAALQQDMKTKLSYTPKDPEVVAKEIEQALFSRHKAVNKDYNSFFRSLVFNVKDEKNTSLRERIFKGELSPRELVKMETKDLANKEIMQYREEQEKKLFTEVFKKKEPEIVIRKTKKGIDVLHLDQTEPESDPDYLYYENKSPSDEIQLVDSPTGEARTERDLLDCTTEADSSESSSPVSSSSPNAGKFHLLLSKKPGDLDLPDILFVDDPSRDTINESLFERDDGPDEDQVHEVTPNVQRFQAEFIAKDLGDPIWEGSVTYMAEGFAAAISTEG